MPHLDICMQPLPGQSLSIVDALPGMPALMQALYHQPQEPQCLMSAFQAALPRGWVTLEHFCSGCGSLLSAAM